MAHSDTHGGVRGFGGGFSALGARLANGWRETLLVLQHARMMKVLSDMSDDQLEQIGISRTDIPSYSRRLIYGDR